MRNKTKTKQSDSQGTQDIYGDDELDQIEGELNQIQMYFERTKGSKFQQLVGQRMGVLKSHLRLEQSIAKLQKFLEIDFLLLPQDRAILSWSKLLITTIVRYFRTIHELSCKQLWAQLFLTRLGYAFDPEGGFISPRSGGSLDPISDFSNDLMDLPTRYKNLKTTERILRESIEKGSQRILDLHQEYHLMEIAKVNISAAHSLNTRMGQTRSDSTRSPMIRFLGQLLLLEVAMVRDSAGYEKLLSELYNQEMQQKNILDLCRQHAELELPELPSLSTMDREEQKKEVSRKMTEDFVNLRLAEQKILRRLKELASPQSQPFHPIIVQKIPKKDNTMVG